MKKSILIRKALLGAAALPLLLTGCTQGESGQPAYVYSSITVVADGDAAPGNYQFDVNDTTGKTRFSLIIGEGETLVNNVKLPANAASTIRVVVSKQRANGGKTRICTLEIPGSKSPFTVRYDGKSCGIFDN